MNERLVLPEEIKAADTKRKWKQRKLLMLIIALAVGRIGYTLIYATGLDQTAALFVGLPMLIAMLITLAPPAKTVGGIATKTTVLLLALIGTILPEGMVCLAMSAPIMFLAIYLGAKFGSEQSSTSARVLAAIPLMVLLTDATVATRQQTVMVEQILPLSAETITTNLASQWAWDEPLPTFTKLGFPVPIDVEGQGLAIGDRRTVTFQQEGKTAQTVWQVAARGDDWVRFENVRDETAIAHWLVWESAEISWQLLPTGEMMVRWSVEYERQLDPALYFAPLQQAFVSRTLDYLMVAIIGGGA